MGDFWKYAEAEGSFKELVRQALTNAPQRVVCDEGRLVVVMSDAHHDRLTEALRRLIAMGGTPPDPVLLPLELLAEEERIAAAVAEIRDGGVGGADDADDAGELLHRLLREEREMRYRALRATEATRASAAD